MIWLLYCACAATGTGAKRRASVRGQVGQETKVKDAWNSRGLLHAADPTSFSYSTAKEELIIQCSDKRKYIYAEVLCNNRVLAKMTDWSCTSTANVACRQTRVVRTAVMSPQCYCVRTPVNTITVLVRCGLLLTTDKIDLTVKPTRRLVFVYTQ